MYFKMICFIFVLLLSSCSSTRDGQIGQLPDSFIEGFDVDDESISKFISKKEPEIKPEDIAVVVKPKSVKKKKVEKKKKEDSPEIVKLKKRYLMFDRDSSKLWKKFSPLVKPGEKYFFSVYFWGIRVGTVAVKVQKDVIVAGKLAYHISGQLQSAKFYQYIYSFDDRLDTYIDKESFVPLKYVLRQRESKQDVDDLQLFDHDKKKTFFLYKKVKKGKNSKKQKKAPTPKFFQDTFSSFFFMRGLPLKVGDSYEFPVISRTKMKIFKIKVVRSEILEVMDEEMDAIRLEASTFLPGVLKEKNKKSNDKIIFWFSNDPEHRFLKVEASVKLGSISGEVVGFCPAEGECVGDFYQ